MDKIRSSSSNLTSSSNETMSVFCTILSTRDKITNVEDKSSMTSMNNLRIEREKEID